MDENRERLAGVDIPEFMKSAEEQEKKRTSREERAAKRKRQKRINTIKTFIAIAVIFLIGVYVGMCAMDEEAVGAEAETVGAVLDLERELTYVAVSTDEPPADETVQVEVQAGYYNENIPLDAETQGYIKETCEKYGVPLALALAVAEKESGFNASAVSGTNDFGMFQINKCNHAWLREQGIDPLSERGNIEAGIYILAGNIERFGDYEHALMAYNSGAGAAERLIGAGVTSTSYSSAVMGLYKKWSELI